MNALNNFVHMGFSLLVYSYYFVLLLVGFAQCISHIRPDLGIEGQGLGLGLEGPGPGVSLGSTNSALTTSDFPSNFLRFLDSFQSLMKPIKSNNLWSYQKDYHAPTTHPISSGTPHPCRNSHPKIKAGSVLRFSDD